MGSGHSSSDTVEEEQATVDPFYSVREMRFRDRNKTFIFNVLNQFKPKPLHCKCRMACCSALYTSTTITTGRARDSWEGKDRASKS